MKAMSEKTLTEAVAELYSEETETIELRLGSAIVGEVECRKIIDMESIGAIVELTAEACVDRDGGMYRPERLHGALATYLFLYYTDAAIMPTAETEAVFFTHWDDVESFFLAAIGAEQFEGIVLAVEKRICHELDVMAAAQARKISEFVDRCSEALNAQTDNLTEIMGRLKDVPEGDMMGLLKAFREDNEKAAEEPETSEEPEAKEEAEAEASADKEAEA